MVFKLFTAARYRPLAICFGLSVFVASSSPFVSAQAQDDPPAFTEQQLEFFETQVRPLLVDKCYSCHGPDSTPIEGGLNLASRKSTLMGGDTGPAIEPGLPDESLLIDAINYGDVYEMPPDTKMSEDEIEIFTKWVEMGAPWPAEPEIEIEREEFDIETRKAAHWCWQPVRQPVVPKVADINWPLTSIDNFVLAKLEAAKISPTTAAAKRTLIRRLYFDLVGLPPTPSQIQSFLDDDSSDAFDKIVDQLLESPRFGERWARHWMDLVRFAETCGHEFDYPIPHAFQYRDYLIRAFNADVPYDQFIREHIAGDLLENPRLHPNEDYNESLIGTGFWFFGEGHHGPVDVKADEAKRIDNQIDVMCKTFLGLTVSCARCHDHKFDAISAKDFYSLAGFLKSSRRQDAMLDPGQKIENSYNEITKLTADAGDAIRQFGVLAQQSDRSHVAEYLNAAVQKLRSSPDWTLPKSVVIQGEAMKTLDHESGEFRIQELKPQGQRFSWQGNKQLWWLDGEVGSKANLEFKLDSAAEEREYEVFANFTKASDYGRANILIDGETVLEDVDFFDAQLSNTGKTSLGIHTLKSGKHQLGLEITGHHESAVPRHMIGIDYLEFVATQTQTPLDSESASRFEKEFGHLDQSLVDNLATAIKSERLNKNVHPLHLLQQISKSTNPIDADWFQRFSKQTKQAQSDSVKSFEDKTNFESFDQGLPGNWYPNGFAVEDSANLSTERFAIQNDLIAEPSAVHSGKDGAKFQGVIRSPTFTIEHDKIFYRIKGGKSRVRLIIEGYQLDIYNPLLFAGMKIDVGASEEYRWVEQSRDLKNHVGRTAHIEVIDQGDGYFSLDQIVFGNRGAPVDPPSQLSLNVLDQISDRQPDVEKITAAVAGQLVTTIGSSGSESAVLKSWIIDNGLAGILKSTTANRTSAIVPDSNFVSAPSPGATCESVTQNLLKLREVARKKSAEIPSPVLVIGMDDGPGQDEHIFIRGNHKTLGKIAKREFLEALTDAPMKLGTGSGRLQLAQKIANPENPLTARVVVNRVWHHLIGRGIVASVDNFGVLGQQPTHPELLDYMASRFVEDGWSIKSLIREIVSTRTYQLSSVPLAESKLQDPDNKLLHSSNIHRLEGEAIRDSILAISGELDETMYGRSVPIHLTEFLKGRGRPGKSGPLDGNGRRSVYVEVRRNFLSPMMLAFDTPAPFNALGRRNRSNVPAQALILMNDPFVFEQAEKWAKRLIEDGQNTDQRIKTIYNEAFGRPPTTDELADATNFIAEYGSKLGISDDAIVQHVETWRDFCHVMFNVKQFIFIE